MYVYYIYILWFAVPKSQTAENLMTHLFFDTWIQHERFGKRWLRLAVGVCDRALFGLGIGFRRFNIFLVWLLVHWPFFRSVWVFQGHKGDSVHLKVGHLFSHPSHAGTEFLTGFRPWKWCDFNQSDLRSKHTWVWCDFFWLLKGPVLKKTSRVFSMTKSHYHRVLCCWILWFWQNWRQGHH